MRDDNREARRVVFCGVGGGGTGFASAGWPTSSEYARIGSALFLSCVGPRSVILCYVLFKLISIVAEQLESEIDTSAVDSRLMIQGRLLSMEGRLKAIENKWDRIERALRR